MDKEKKRSDILEETKQINKAAAKADKVKGFKSKTSAEKWDIVEAHLKKYGTIE